MDQEQIDRFNQLLDQIIVGAKPLTVKEREEYNELCAIWYDYMAPLPLENFGF